LHHTTSSSLSSNSNIFKKLLFEFIKRIRKKEKEEPQEELFSRVEKNTI
jgi:hypothetical protein